MESLTHLKIKAFQAIKKLCFKLFYLLNSLESVFNLLMAKKPLCNSDLYQKFLSAGLMRTAQLLLE